MDLPTVVNRHHFKGKEDLPQPWIYIGRGTPLGNPYTLKEHGEEGALALYKRWLHAKIMDLDDVVIAELRRITPQHHLVCSCKPRACHGDVVVSAWEWCVRRRVIVQETYAQAERAALMDERYH